jgi:hypothetical protein
MEITKLCTKCWQEKKASEFSKNKKGLHGLHCYCRDCQNKISKINYQENIEKKRIYAIEYHKNNREKILQYNKESRPIDHERINKNARANYWKNIGKMRRVGREKYRAHREEHNKATREWQLNNPDKCRAASKKHYLKKLSTPKGKLENSIRVGIYQSLKKGIKGRRHWCDLVGYTIDQLMKHIEKQFLPGMSWDNYGKHTWHIDHKIPVSVFNFEIAEDIDFKKCWSLENLRPLWAKENWAKNDKLDKPFQPSLPIAVNY